MQYQLQFINLFGFSNDIYPLYNIYQSLYYPHTMTFRSLQMKQYQMIIPKDSVYATANTLGYENVIHFTDQGDPSNRQFSQLIKRCDQSLHKIQIIAAELKKNLIQLDQYDETQDLFVPNLSKNWKQQAKGLNVDQIRLIDVYEERVADQYKRFQELSLRKQKIEFNKKINLEKIACMEVLSKFFGNSQPKAQAQQYYLNNISEVDQIQGISFLISVVDNQMQWKLSKMVYRVSRGYACMKSVDLFQFPGLRDFNKKVVLVIYPSSDTQLLEKKLRRVVETFSENLFSPGEFEFSAKSTYQTAVKQYNEICNFLEMGEKEYRQFLVSMKKMSNIETWRLFFWKEKALYECLNKFDRREQFYIANIYIPKIRIQKVTQLLNKVVPSPTLHQIAVVRPPTAYNTNSYTMIAQEITDTYGVPRYQQVNPSIFATITFPFFFGVMFGDVMHGAMIFAFGLFAIKYNKILEKGSFKMLSQFRYMITLMGFFAIYCGFIYNDFAGFNMNFFSSCFDPPFHPKQTGEEATQIHLRPIPGCVYPFGIDPVWGRAENELVYVNSLKMKISVIIAIIHMTLGVCCKAANTSYFKKKLDFYFQFVPQFIFLVLLFGYMDFLIIFKWLKPWNQRYDDKYSPTQWAPSIITTMMNLGLKLGQTSTIPDGGSNMWGEVGKSSQDKIQLIIVLIAFLCVPLMLIPKPYIEIQKKKKESKNMKQNPLANDEENLMEESRNALEQRLISGKKHQHQHQSQHSEQNSQIIVHQLIETIEFVLGAISNTASYLRLWALSLAHSQLSKVFFKQTAGQFVGSKDMVVQFLSLFVGSWMVMWITFGIILCMDSMQCFLHSLRLHWVEFQNKFYKGDGYRYAPLSYKEIILSNKKS